MGQITGEILRPATVLGQTPDEIFQLTTVLGQIPGEIFQLTTVPDQITGEILQLTTVLGQITGETFQLTTVPGRTTGDFQLFSPERSVALSVSGSPQIMPPRSGAPAPGAKPSGPLRNRPPSKYTPASPLGETPGARRHSSAVERLSCKQGVPGSSPGAGSLPVFPGARSTQFFGGVAERSMAADCKSAGLRPT